MSCVFFEARAKKGDYLVGGVPGIDGDEPDGLDLPQLPAMALIIAKRFGYCSTSCANPPGGQDPRPGVPPSMQAPAASAKSVPM